MIVTVRTFQKGEKKFKLWRSTPVFYISSAILIIMCLLLSQNVFNQKINDILKLIGYPLIAAPLITLFWGMNELELLNGKIEGEIKFTPTQINIQKQPFQITDLDKIVFEIQSYYEEKVNYITLGSSGPCLSQGVNNNISFEFNEEKFNYPFQLESKRHLEMLKKYIKTLESSGVILEYYYKGKLVNR